MNRTARATDLGGVTKRLLPLRISSLIPIFAAVLIAAFTCAMLYVGRLSSQEADQQAYNSEINLFRHVLDSRFIMLARDQFQVGVWDETVQHVSLDFDADYVTDQIVSSLWYNYGLDRTMLIGADLKALIEKAVAQYMKNRITIKGGFSARGATVGDHAVMLSEIGNIYEGAFQTIEGKPALVSAMAVTPDVNEVPLPDGPPAMPPATRSSVPSPDGSRKRSARAAW